MKKLYKLCSLVICVALLVSALAGCGGKEEKNDGIITLRWYIPQVDCADRMLVQEEINKILAKDGLAIEWLFVDAGKILDKANLVPKKIGFLPPFQALTFCANAIAES